MILFVANNNGLLFSEFLSEVIARIIQGGSCKWRLSLS